MLPERSRFKVQKFNVGSGKIPFQSFQLSNSENTVPDVPVVPEIPAIKIFASFESRAPALSLPNGFHWRLRA